MHAPRSLMVAMAAALTVCVAPFPSFDLIAAQEAPQEDVEKKKTRKEKRKENEGRRKGVRVGAITGLALGALTGDAELAVKGAAAGAVVGGASGVMYDYDQSRQDDRTQLMADAIAGSKAQDIAPQETVGDVGKRHMQDFLGNWKLEMWGLDENGEKVTGTGTVKGVALGENMTRILYQDIEVDGVDEAFGGGYTLMTYEPGQGFFLENGFSFTNETLKFTGEYLADKNTYNYYLTNYTDGQMVTGEIMRSSVRLEIRVATPSLWFAEAYTHIDGKEVKVQSYRFIKS